MGYYNFSFPSFFTFSISLPPSSFPNPDLFHNFGRKALRTLVEN